ncbi:MAG: apolipoprotein N-acyltransferase, partial [Burkholderiales bacterium]
MRPRVALVALIAGIVHAASFAPIGAWWLQIAAMAVPVALLLRAAATGETRVTRAAVPGLAFGLGWFVTGVSWLYVSMHRYGGMPAPIAALAVLL